MAVIILSLVLIPLLSQFYTCLQGSVIAEKVTQAIDLADDLMEEIKGKRFDENIYPASPTVPAQLGVDSGEDTNDRRTFDDVDDYNSWQKSPPQSLDGTQLSEFTGFTETVAVNYITLSGSTWIDSSQATNYKKIKVTISHAKIADKVLETIVAYY